MQTQLDLVADVEESMDTETPLYMQNQKTCKFWVFSKRCGAICLYDTNT